MLSTETVSVQQFTKEVMLLVSIQLDRESSLGQSGAHKALHPPLKNRGSEGMETIQPCLSTTVKRLRQRSCYGVESFSSRR